MKTVWMGLLVNGLVLAAVLFFSTTLESLRLCCFLLFAWPLVLRCEGWPEAYASLVMILTVALLGLVDCDERHASWESRNSVGHAFGMGLVLLLMMAAWAGFLTGFMVRALWWCAGACRANRAGVSGSDGPN